MKLTSPVAVIAISLGVALCGAFIATTPAHASEDCNSFVGKTYVTDESKPALSFEEKRSDGIYLDEHITPSQKFQVTARESRDNGNDDLTVVTSDTRELHIECFTFKAAIDPTYPRQHVIQSDAADSSHIKAALQAKKDAADFLARRRRQAALARQAAERAAQAETAEETRKYIAQRIARGGVKMGMTESQVLASSWGSPDKKHYTVTPGVDAEQWVYANQFFLYFTNGILTGIQTDTPSEGYFRLAH
jgi:hypothetical protein